MQQRNFRKLKAGPEVIRIKADTSSKGLYSIFEQMSQEGAYIHAESIQQTLMIQHLTEIAQLAQMEKQNALLEALLNACIAVLGEKELPDAPKE